MLGRVTASGALRRFDPAATDGSQNPIAVLLNRADAREGDVRQTVIALSQGSTLAEHENPGAATLHVLHGRVVLHAGDLPELLAA